MSKMATVVRNILLAFVLVTVGFALGKAAARRERTDAPSPASVGAVTNAATPSGESPTRVHVFYAHTTVRCSTCNTMERLGIGVVKGHYAAELADGRVLWKVVDFQRDEAFAKRYEIVSSCIVVAAVKGGKEIAHRRLDEVWTHVHNPPAFENYLVESINALLGTEAPQE